MFTHDEPKIRVSDTVIVMNSHGLKLTGNVQSIRKDRAGRLIYKVVSPGNFVLQVYKRQTVEARFDMTQRKTEPKPRRTSLGGMPPGNLFAGFRRGAFAPLSPESSGTSNLDIRVLDPGQIFRVHYEVTIGILFTSHLS